MICCSINKKSAKEILDILEKVEMAEVRMDLCELSDEDIEEIFISDTPLVATCRAKDGDFHETERKLLLAIKAGANYADLEIEAPGSVARRIQRACTEFGTVLIRSFHDFKGTGSIDSLREMADKCRNMGGEIVKIATAAKNKEDAARVLTLYKYYAPDGLIAFAMGESGRMSRLECLALGSPFTYAATSENEASAPGQISYAQMQEMLHSKAENRQLIFKPSQAIQLPASKSYAQRAIIAAALSEGQSVLKAYSPCEDSEAAIAVAQALGAKVVRTPDTAVVESKAYGFETLTIDGIGSAGVGTVTTGTSAGSASTGTASTSTDTAGTANAGTAGTAGTGVINVGQSGLLARLMIPLAAQLFGAQGSIIQGRGTLLERPMAGAEKMMAAFGGAIKHAGGAAIGKADGPANENNAAIRTADGPANNNGAAIGTADGPANKATDGLMLPVRVSGPLRGGRAVIDGSKTSQLISGAMMALPLAARGSTLVVNNPTSIPYLYITMEILRRFGIKTKSRMFGGNQMLSDDWQMCDSIEVKIKENQRYKACDMTVEADWSAAAVFMAAGAVFGKVQLEGLDTSSLQADIMMLDILMDAGASISQADEPKGIITIQKAPLRAIEEDLSNCPDLFPVTAVFCAFCQGKSQLGGVHRLVHKESDRAKGILEMLSQLGVKASIKDDVMQIEGESLASRILNSRLLNGGNYTSNHDHRMVMALSLACPGADGPIKIDDTDCVGKSFPGFNNLWKNLIVQKELV